MMGSSPADARDFADWLFWILTDDRDTLGRSNIVTRMPCQIVPVSEEVFFNNLLSPGETVAPTHA
jgi:hypothetical protein